MAQSGKAGRLQMMQQATEAQEARVREEERQARLKTGAQAINKIFDESGINNAFGGFNDAFYDNYTQAQNDYYLPDVQRQYDKARENLTFDLARAGLGSSSVAGDQVADLLYQNQNNVAAVRAKSDAGTADLRQRVAQEKANALSQLYATEDPTMASNNALASAKAVSNSKPELNPLGDIFKLAVIGGGQFASAYGNPYNGVGSNQTRKAGRDYPNG